MTAYLIRRFVQAVAVVFGVTIIVFLILHALPGGPARGLLGPEASAFQVHQFIVAERLQPAAAGAVRPVHRPAGAGQPGLLLPLQPDGRVAAEPGPAQERRAWSGWPTWSPLIIAIPLGIMQAVRRNRPADYVTTGASFVAYSMPIFWLGILLITGLRRQLAPAAAGGTAGRDGGRPCSPTRTRWCCPWPPWPWSPSRCSAGTCAPARSRPVAGLHPDGQGQGPAGAEILFRHVLRNSLIPDRHADRPQPAGTISGGADHRVHLQLSRAWACCSTPPRPRHDFPVLLGVTWSSARRRSSARCWPTSLYAVARPPGAGWH